MTGANQFSHGKIIGGRKKCNVCSHWKPLRSFYPNKSCLGNVTGSCRLCTAASKRKWYADNRKRRQDVANKRNRAMKQRIVKDFGGVCFDCEQSFPDYVFEFHHLDPKEKDFNPSYLMTGKLERMWKELAKCIMLCANCHKIRHRGERKVWDEGVN